MKRLLICLLATLLFVGCKKPVTNEPDTNTLTPDTPTVNEENTSVVGNYFVKYEEEMNGEIFEVTYWVVFNDDKTGTLLLQDVADFTYDDTTIYLTPYPDTYTYKCVSNGIELYHGGNLLDTFQKTDLVPELDFDI